MVHLQEISLMKNSDEEFLRWNRSRVDRILVDYLLREGYFRSATKLAKDYDIEVYFFVFHKKWNSLFSFSSK